MSLKFSDKKLLTNAGLLKPFPILLSWNSTISLSLSSFFPFIFFSKLLPWIPQKGLTLALLNIDEDISIVDVFEGIGAYEKGIITKEDLYNIECAACPGVGSCAGMFTANTMASVGEAIGMSLPGTAAIPAEDPKLREAAVKSGEQLNYLLKNDIKPSDIMTEEAFNNAIVTVLALGGSTNAVLHLLAIAYETGVSLTIDKLSLIHI